jgi:hypothetical protein
VQHQKELHITTAREGVPKNATLFTVMVVFMFGGFKYDVPRRLLRQERTLQ